LPILASSAFLLYFFTLDSKITIIESVILLTALMIYIIYTIKNHFSFNELEKSKNESKDIFYMFKEFFILIFSGFFIYLGAKYTINSTINCLSYLA